jgi:hypothetical protein
MIPVTHVAAADVIVEVLVSLCYIAPYCMSHAPSWKFFDLIDEFVPFPVTGRGPP